MPQFIIRRATDLDGTTMNLRMLPGMRVIEELSDGTLLVEAEQRIIDDLRSASQELVIAPVTLHPLPGRVRATIR